MTFRPDEMIPAHLRYLWIKSLFPGVEIITLAPPTPYSPDESPSSAEFYAVWKQSIVEQCGELPDVVFTSECYGDEISNFWGIAHVCVDLARLTVPISGTMIRNDLARWWDYLDPTVRRDLVMTVCLNGPESCGKTRLAEQLGQHYQTEWQPEFAREWLGRRHCVYEDMQPIAEGHLRERIRLRSAARAVLFVDTDTITTKVYSEKYYNRCPDRIEQIIRLPESRSDLTLLLTPDVPWIEDTSRDLGRADERSEMYERFEKALNDHEFIHIPISGSWEDRFSQAVAAIDKLLLRG